MPAHAAGNVDVTVISALSQARASVPGGYAYVVTTGPVISELLPNIGWTDGGTPIRIRYRFRSGLTVRVDGIVSTDHYLESNEDHPIIQRRAMGLERWR